MNQPPPDRRRAPRRPVLRSAICHTDTGRVGDVVIVDLTAQGCCIQTNALALTAGLRVRLEPFQFDTLAGVVRWCDRGRAGIAFDRPLHPAVAEHLQETWAPGG
jgi:hypothetical protein